MSAPSLDVLRIQAEHIHQQADALRSHLEAHANLNTDFTGARSHGHLTNGHALCAGIVSLADHVHACITCAIDKQKPLPVCAGDKPVLTTVSELKARMDVPASRDPADAWMEADGAVLCPVCRGTGANPLSDYGNNSLPCEVCRGSGKTPIPPALDPKTGKLVPW